MRKTILKYGLICGAILSGMMLLTLLIVDHIGLDQGELVGYTSMVAGFLLIYFGVRSYRDRVAGGSIGFLRAWGLGLAIALVGSLCYVATWEALFFGGFYNDFLPKYQAYVLEQARKQGASDEVIAKKKEEMVAFEKMYNNPLINAAFTFLEPLPVGVIMSLVTAGILRRRRESGPAGAAANA